MPTTAGECIYENFKLEYQIVRLEYVHKKCLKIEAICLNPRNSLDKEVVFKYSTNNLNVQSEKLKISFSIIDSLIKNLDLQKDKIYKLVVKNGGVFYIHSL
jgi:hypothetical protein